MSSNALVKMALEELEMNVALLVHMNAILAMTDMVEMATCASRFAIALMEIPMGSEHVASLTDTNVQVAMVGTHIGVANVGLSATVRTELRNMLDLVDAQLPVTTNVLVATLSLVSRGVPMTANF